MYALIFLYIMKLHHSYKGPSIREIERMSRLFAFLFNARFTYKSELFSFITTDLNLIIIMIKKYIHRYVELELVYRTPLFNNNISLVVLGFL